MALLLTVGVLGLLGVLATAFVTMARLERKSSLQALGASRAVLASRAGAEDALARLARGQDPSRQEAAYLGEDHNADGLVNAGVELASQVYLVTGAGTPADTVACPVRHAMRPSFWKSAGGVPKLVGVEGRQRGYSGDLSGGGEQVLYALKVEDLNGRIHVNGGALDALDRDPDGAGPLAANGIPDFRDASGEGPNGFLRRLLDNLESVMAGGVGSPSFGDKVISGRPLGGYARLEDLKAVLGQASYDLVKGSLTAQAWVDPKVVRPQPADHRPKRWLDIDDGHRTGAWMAAIAGKATSSAVSGQGTSSSPWTQNITTTNAQEGTRTYPVTWERGQVYAHKQLRLGPVQAEPRAPVSLNSASREVLAAVLLGLKGTYLEVWDGAAGWDGGHAFYQPFMSPVEAPFPYPSPGTEETPWTRTRADYGMPYATSLPRQWYGPMNPDSPSLFVSGAGESLVGSGALGRLRTTAAIGRLQALALADQIRLRIQQKGPFRTWPEFGEFVDALPLKEDVNGDGVLDGAAYPVNSNSTAYQRRRYEREDADSDGVLRNERFTIVSGDWNTGVSWSTAVGPQGLTFVQKDVLKAMANPNTDLNDFNPDGNLFKEVDKTDLGGSGSVASGGAWLDDANAYAHTTEFSLDPMGFLRILSVGRCRSEDRLLAERQGGMTVRLFEARRDTTQADFMKAYLAGGALSATFRPSVPASPLPLCSGQYLLSYPEPQTLPGGVKLANADYDGQVGLGVHAAAAGPDERVRGDLFLDLNATPTGDASTPDVRGPYHAPLVAAGALTQTGNLFPDGLYSEKDSALKLPMAGNFEEHCIVLANGMSDPNTFVFYIAAWVKPNWFPEASPRPHALFSVSPGHRQMTPLGQPLLCGAWHVDLSVDRHPSNRIPMHPAGCYFVPARNNFSVDSAGAVLYDHSSTTTLGEAWQRRSLLWGTAHSLYGTDALHFGGILRRPPGNWLPADPDLPVRTRPLGRLQAHRWVHLACIAITNGTINPGSQLILGRRGTSTIDGGGWDFGWGRARSALSLNHDEAGGGSSPNHLRFGEVSAQNNMNWTADATFAGIRQGGVSVPRASYLPTFDAYQTQFTGAASPAVAGRYLKEGGAQCLSERFQPGAAPLRVTWTEMPCDLWFDFSGDGWPGDDLAGTADDYRPVNDFFGPGGAAGADGLRDVRIDLEAWDDRGTATLLDDVKLGLFRDAGAANAIPDPLGQLYWRAVFVNDWNLSTRANHPLDVTPFLDDVTVTYLPVGGPRVLAWAPDLD